MKMDATLLFITCIASFKMTFAELILTPEPLETVLAEGDNMTAMCKLNKPISGCAWDVLLGGKFLDLDPERNLSAGIKYFGQGFKQGECGIIILNVTEEHNRLFKCRVNHSETTDNSSKLTQLFNTVRVVVICPHISVTRTVPVNGTYGYNILEENITILAECKIERIIPTANIFWFIGNEPIKDGFGALEVENVGLIGLERITVRRNLTRNLTFLDNGESLICEVHHTSLRPETVIRRTSTLNIYFPPKLKEIHQRAFTIGQPGEIAVITYANPKPTIEWLVDGKKIQKGTRDETGKFRAHYLNSKGKHTWEAVLQIDDVSSEDAKKNYTFTAKNIAGEIEIRVLIPGCNKFSSNITACLPLPNDFPAPNVSDSVGLNSNDSATPSSTDFPTSNSNDFAATDSNDSAAPTSDDFAATPTCSAEATTCPSIFFDPTTCPAPSVDITAWSITTIVTAILLIISVKFIWSRLTQRGSYTVTNRLEEAVEMAF